MTDRMALLEAVAEEVRDWFEKHDRGVHANPADMRAALAALGALSSHTPEPPGEVVEVRGCAGVDEHGSVYGYCAFIPATCTAGAGAFTRSPRCPMTDAPTLGRRVYWLGLRYVPASLMMWGCWTIGVWVGGVPLHEPTLWATLAAVGVGHFWMKISDEAKLPTGWER